MRPITGGPPPPSLTAWTRAETVAENRHYRSLPTAVKEDIRDQRVRNQHGLCAYTQRRIGHVIWNGRPTWDAHVEHVVTQKSSLAQGRLSETVDFGNLVACVDRGSTLPYGAPARGDSGQPLPVTPFHPNCAVRFLYHATGRIDGTDAAANTVIEMLRLNHAELLEHRRAALAGRGIGVPRNRASGVRRLPSPRISAGNARRFAKESRLPNSEGLLPEFSEALAQVYEAHALRIEQARRAAGFARRQP